MELGHLYTVATREDDEPGPSIRHASTSVLRRNYGYQALVHARRTSATAKVCCNSAEVGFEVIICLCAQVVLLVCHGVHRGEGGDRIVAEVVTRDETSGTFFVSGLSRVQCGFSFPVQNAPRQYDGAIEAAVAGIRRLQQRYMGDLLPWPM